MTLSDRLFEEGVFAQGIGFPTVPRGKARVRTIVTATHSRDELQFALERFQHVGIELGILQ
jgi:glycine C-acetyltransferase